MKKKNKLENKDSVGFRLMLRWYYFGCVGITLVELVFRWYYVGYVGVRYLTPYFGYIRFYPHVVWSVECLAQESPKKKYTKEKTETDKRRRRFFYTFLYLLGSTTIPWMREFFLNTFKSLNPPVKVSKIR